MFAIECWSKSRGGPWRWLEWWNSSSMGKLWENWDCSSWRRLWGYLSAAFNTWREPTRKMERELEQDVLQGPLQNRSFYDSIGKCSARELVGSATIFSVTFEWTENLQFQQMYFYKQHRTCIHLNKSLFMNV